MSINYSAATMAIIDALGKDPDTRYHVRAAAEQAKISVGAASMILHSLESSGLFTVEQLGNMRLYKYNLFNPEARQWKVLFNLGRLRDLGDMLSGVAEQAILFGSAADGTNGRDSDLDVFVLTEKEAQAREILRMFQRKRRWSIPLSAIIMNAARFARLRREDPSMYDSILRGKELWRTG